MRFSTAIASALVAGSAVIASPLAPGPSQQLVAGHVVTNKDVTYQMVHFDEVKTFDNKVDNGEYPFPVTYQVEEGFTCIFYTEASRGVGAPIGEFVGPMTGSFGKNWIECYKCWFTKDNRMAARAPTLVVKEVRDKAAIPCGFARLAEGGTASLNDTGKKFKSPANFAINGDYYYPRGGPKMIGEEHGEADGELERGRAGRYACWTGA
ncbi:hypothetical protein BDU57DRAFT_451677 [Ampelomyces quisqualis]|uniref:Uncharacterized protein n=1 Tax=Ampelomyces quisqualis TaxID=50730 RepID=A0A6A5QMM8_AMPQU|nr:hypothetical protein BDU57DRAFT_451677 [Ampelomyces quisqualis]